LESRVPALSATGAARFGTGRAAPVQFGQSVRNRDDDVSRGETEFLSRLEGLIGIESEVSIGIESEDPIGPSPRIQTGLSPRVRL